VFSSRYYEERSDEAIQGHRKNRIASSAQLGKQQGLSVSELAKPFPVSLPAIMKHLDVLSDAGLIARSKTGRTVACWLTAKAMDWLNRYQRFWSDRLDRLAACVEEDSWPPNPALPATQAPSPPEPHPQTSSQCATGESLGRLDRPGKNSALVRARAHQGRLGAQRTRRPRRRPFPRQLQHG
jgi:DNA-binding transcriptional ArsR family regulator